MQRTTTQVWPVDPASPSQEALAPAVRALRDGELVAFPTETVYGLGADALNPAAVRRIFVAKGRPADNPLIVHVASVDMAYQLMANREAHRVFAALAEVFWPGPLTMVVKHNGKVDPVVTAGLDTVGLRMPEHPIALALIRALGRPVAAPSANRSGRPSPTTAEHVLNDMSGRIAGIVDGGAARVGVESTVLDITVSPPILLRPGGVTPEALSEVLGVRVEVDPNVHQTAVDADSVHGAVRSPGMKYQHYAPVTPLLLLEDPSLEVERLRELVESYESQGLRVGLLLTEETAALYPEGAVLTLGPRSRPERIAANLFAALRSVDRGGFDLVIVEGIAPVGIGLAVMNRLRRAARIHIRDAP